MGKQMFFMLMGLLVGGYVGWESYFHLAVGDYVLADYVFVMIPVLIFSFLGFMLGKKFASGLTLRLLKRRLVDLTEFDDEFKANQYPFSVEIYLEKNKKTKIFFVKLCFGNKTLIELMPGDSFNYCIKGVKGNEKTRLEVYRSALVNIWQKTFFWIDEGKETQYCFFLEKPAIITTESLIRL